MRHSDSTIIEPRVPWHQLELSEVWRHRELVQIFVWRDFIAIYKQTVLGPLWHVVQPLLTAATMTLVFGLAIRIPTEGAPPHLFFLLSTVIWNFFASCLTRTSGSFVTNSALFSKVYFPRVVMPIAILISGLLGLAIQLLVFLVIALPHWLAPGISGGRPTAWVLATPLLLLLAGGLGLAGGLFVSALTTRYRDLQVAVPFGTQLLMYLSPVIYPVSALPARFRDLIELNPLSTVLEGLRLALLGAGSVTVPRLVTASMATFLLVLGGLVLFTAAQRDLVDTV